MSDRETPDEVIETDDGTVEEFDDADDVTEDDGADDDADGADDDASDDDVDVDGADEDDADEGDSPDDELADREANEALVAEQFEEDGDAEHSDAGDSDEDADAADPGGDALVSRLRVIGRQPLAERAVALHQLHDELRAELESGDPSRR